MFPFILSVASTLCYFLKVHGPALGRLMTK